MDHHINDWLNDEGIIYRSCGGLKPHGTLNTSLPLLGHEIAPALAPPDFNQEMKQCNAIAANKDVENHFEQARYLT